MRSATKKSASKTGTRAERPVWKGFLKFSLVSIPVKAITARARNGPDVELHWLHSTCHSRIHYKKVCPIHGEVSDGEIVSGYQTGKKTYVVIEPEELNKLRGRRDDTLEITNAVSADAIDPMYYTDRSYFLLPNGEAGVEAYRVFLEALTEQRRIGIAQMVLFRKEQLMVLRPRENILVMTSLSYPDVFKDVGAFSDKAPSRPSFRSEPRELELAKTLLSQLSGEDFDFARLRDPRGKALHELIQAKIKGQEVKAPEEEEPPASLDFMAVLKKSLAQAGEKPARGHHGHRARHRKVS